jgi:hypothetical protein
MTVLTPASTPSRAPVNNAARELNWSYVRGTERQLCRLSLDAGERAYEFVVQVDDVHHGMKLERYAFASDAIQRHCEYEAELLSAGFSLESFSRKSAD